MMTKRAGPPVPPRPSNAVIKQRSGSPPKKTNPKNAPSSNSVISTVTSANKVHTISAKISGTVESGTSGTDLVRTSSNTGRTVIYKSPSFDQKKKEQELQLKYEKQQRQNYAEDVTIRKNSINNNSNNNNSRIICNTTNINAMNGNGDFNEKNANSIESEVNRSNYVQCGKEATQRTTSSTSPSTPSILSPKELSQKTIFHSEHMHIKKNTSTGSSNRTEIVIINNSRTANSKGLESTNNNVKINHYVNNNFNLTKHIDLESINNNKSVGATQPPTSKADKISPVPKPRTTVNGTMNIGSNKNTHKSNMITNNINANINVESSTIPSDYESIRSPKITTTNEYNQSSSIISSNSNKSEITIIDKSGNAIKTNQNSNNIFSNSNNNNHNNKNIEIENNLKNAAERLFTEIRINHTKDAAGESNRTVKTEHCISVRSTPSPTAMYPNKSFDERSKSTKDITNGRTCVNLLQRPDPEGGEYTYKANENETKKPTNDFDEKLPPAKKVAFHEMLISELTAMRRNNSMDTLSTTTTDNEDIPKHQTKSQRKRYPSGCSTDSSPYGTQRSRIRTSDWVEVGDNGKEVMLTSCHISLEDSGLEDEERLDDMSSGVGDSWDSAKDVHERMSLPGLPPLPKSLSGLEITCVPVHNNSGSLGSLESQRGLSPISRMMTSAPSTNSTTSTLDTQLAILRREMFGLRQLDLSLLSQLWALNESIQEFRTMLQEQETLSPPSPSPSPSDANSVSSGDEDDMMPTIGKTLQTSQLPAALQRMRSAPPPPPPVRKAPQRPV